MGADCKGCGCSAFPLGTVPSVDVCDHWCHEISQFILHGPGGHLFVDVPKENGR